MKYYIVKALSVGGRKKVFRSGDLVNENNFPEGMADKLVAQGFLTPYDSDNEPVPSQSAEEVETEVTVTEKEEADQTAEGQDEQEESDEEGDEGGEESEDDVTRNEIMKELKELGVSFNRNASKAELYDLWKKSK